MADRKPGFSGRKLLDLSRYAKRRPSPAPQHLALWERLVFLLIVPFFLVLALLLMILLPIIDLFGRVTGLYRLEPGSTRLTPKPALPTREAFDEEVGRLLELANKGDTEAQTDLGRLYETGSGGTQDHEQALRWYRIAAAQGDPYAHLALAKMYEYGFGVKRDLVQALMWCELALEFEHMIDEPEDHTLTNEVDRVIKRLKARMTEEQIEEARGLVEESFGRPR